MLSDSCIAHRVDHVYDDLARQIYAMKKGALADCHYKTDFVKKMTFSNRIMFASKMAGDEGRPFCANILGQLAHAGDGTRITALGNWWAGNPSDASGGYVRPVSFSFLLICLLTRFFGLSLVNWRTPLLVKMSWSSIALQMHLATCVNYGKINYHR